MANEKKPFLSSFSLLKNLNLQKPKELENLPWTWEQYKNWISKMTQDGKKFWYRGQPNSAWTLKTTFHRIADRTKMTMLQYLDLISSDMLYEVSSRLNRIFDLANEFEFASYLALLRNHGFPTPLLDWTLSPYIAAYFAFRECDTVKPECRCVRVYIFNYELWKNTYVQPNDLRSSDMYVSVIRPFAQYNPRQLAQNTVYTVTNVSDMQVYIIMLKKTEPFLYNVDFSIDIKNDVMRELDLMGINEMTLFQDLDGLCKTMKLRYFGE